jgi:hypothetical protein
MLHAWVQRFDVTGGRGNILGSERGLDMKMMIFQVFWGKENVDKKRNTNPILRGSLIFT